MMNETAIEALTTDEIKINENISVYPLTLSHYILLEKIGSYLVSQHEPDMMEVIKSFYICCNQKTRDILRNIDTLDEIAMEWGEQLSPSDIPVITEAILKQIAKMNNVIPQTREDSKKKETSQTGG